MNENVLMENPLAIFNDFAEIPEQAFINDSEEIRGLIRTIINSDDFLIFLTEALTNNPEKIEKELTTLKSIYKDAKNGKFPKQKEEIAIAFSEEILQSIEEIQQFGGAFKKIKVPITKIHPDAIIPKYATLGDAGMDVYALEDVVINPNETKLIRTGIKIAVPGGYYMAAVPKSGISLKTKMRLANTPGTIDSGYRGEICIIVDNIGNEIIHFTKGSKLIQLILQKIPHVEWNEITEEEFNNLSNTDRGSGGFGSTGK
jgi:dUTP pyrophosphatase